MLNEYQLNIVNRRVDAFPDLEEFILAKYNTFLLSELPAEKFDEILSDMENEIERLYSLAQQ